MRSLAILTLLAAAGSLAGLSAGPFLARAHPTVRQAALVAEAQRDAPIVQSPEVEAFRDAGRLPQDLREEALAVARRFRVGGVLFGLFFGVAVGLKFLGQSGIPNEPFYHMDREACVSCGRCFAHCPREQFRRGLIGEAQVEALRHG